MEKIPAHKSKFYSKLSSTVVSGAGESSHSTFPLLHPRPNFLPVKDNPEPGGDLHKLPRVSLVSKICASLRQFHQRCPLTGGLPCIDRILSPSRRKGRGNDLHSKHVRYRRPKSHRQLELAQFPPKAVTTTRHPQKPSYQRPLSIMQKDENIRERKVKVESVELSRNLRRDEFPLVHGRTRPRRLYTPDGKVVHYVIPCHSDSSFTDHTKNHRMTQVNSESLIKIQVEPLPLPEPEVTVIKSEGQLELGQPTKLPEEVNLQLSPELRRPASSPQLKRVTFSENLVEEFSGKFTKGTTTRTAAVSPDWRTRKSKIPKLNRVICVLNSEIVNNEEAPDNVSADVSPEDPLCTPKYSPLLPPRRRRVSAPIAGRNSKLEANAPVDLRPASGIPKFKSPENPGQKPRSTSQVRKPQFENPAPPFLRPKSYNRVTEAWFPGAVDRESWDRQKPLRAPQSKNEVRNELHLKFGRFPKVLEMKKQKFGEESQIQRPATVTPNVSPAGSPRLPKSIPRLISASVSSSSFSTTFQDDESPRVNPSMRSSYPTVTGAEIKAKRLRTRLDLQESRTPRGGEPLKKGLLARNISRRQPLLTRRMRAALDGDNWASYNAVDPEVKNGRPSTAT